MRCMWRSIRNAEEVTDFCDESDHGGAVHRCLHGIMHLIEDHASTGRHPCALCGQQSWWKAIAASWKL